LLSFGQLENRNPSGFRERYVDGLPPSTHHNGEKREISTKPIELDDEPSPCE
jgi:hypothetical protein